MSVDIRKLETERLENLVRNFQWVTVKTEHPPGKIIITIEKQIDEIIPAGLGGPQ